MKLAAAVVSILGTVIETASITIIKAPAHPLSTFIMKQWAGAGEWAGTGIRLGRGLGTLGGLLLAGHDFFENLPAAIDNNDNHLKKLYFASGILGTYISVAPFFNVPLFWPALIASILVAIAIASYKSSAIKTWISHCKFSNIDQYQSLTDELKSFNFLIGG